jgi:hypothetical protein
MTDSGAAGGHEQAALLRHFLAALAYRTQKALQAAPEGYSELRAGPGVRTPRELVRHMTSVIGYATTFYEGGAYTAEPLATLDAEVQRFHAMLQAFSTLLAKRPSPGGLATAERLLQGPLADAMTHAGQLAMLRRLSGVPVPPENFLKADVRADNVGSQQPPPAAPGRRDGTWDPRGEGPTAR